MTIDSFYFTENIEEIYPFSEEAAHNYILAFRTVYGKDVEELDIVLKEEFKSTFTHGIGFFYLHETLRKVKYECMKIITDRDVHSTYSIMGSITSWKGPVTARGTIRVIPISLNNKEKFICTVKDVLTYNV